MTHTNLVRFVVLGTVAFLAVAFADVQTAEAQRDRTPFKWTKYTAKDGKEYDNPIWHDAGGGKRELTTASGTLTFKENPAVTKVVFKVYRRGAQGGWNAAPVITYPVNPAATYDGVVGGWTLVGKDNNTPKIQFDEGEELRGYTGIIHAAMPQVTAFDAGRESSGLCDIVSRRSMSRTCDI